MRSGLSVSLLGTEAYRNALAVELGAARQEIIVLSAYVTEPGFRWIISKINNDELAGKIVVRWRPDDLLTGASDLNIYKSAKNNGWQIYVYPDLHAKTVLIDKAKVFVGSANVTASGLSLVPGANKELGVQFEATSLDLDVVMSTLDESTLVTDEIFQILKSFIQDNQESDGLKKLWPQYIQSLFEKPPLRLWVADFLWSTPQEIFDDSQTYEKMSSVEHDLRILGLDPNRSKINFENLKLAFSRSRPFKWLLNCLRQTPDQELYFGAASSLLHEALLDDPSPYRKDVKSLLQNLITWIQYFDVSDVRIDVPGRHSQRIKLYDA